jgi:hypothetical protein
MDKGYYSLRVTLARPNSAKLSALNRNRGGCTAAAVANLRQAGDEVGRGVTKEDTGGVGHCFGGRSRE